MPLDANGRRRGRASTRRTWRPVAIKRLGPLDLRPAGADAGGLSWVASRVLPARAILVDGEKPLLTVPTLESSSSAGEAALNATTAFFGLDQRVRSAVLQLCRGPPSATEFRESARQAACQVMQTLSGKSIDIDEAQHVIEAMQLNAFEGLNDDLLLFEDSCRFNHACAPNAEYGLAESGEMKVRTLRRIEPGEEVFISYLGDNGLLSREARRAILRQRYLFECNCCLCQGCHDEWSAWACAQCGSRVIETQACSQCNTPCVLLEATKKETISLEKRVATMAFQIEMAASAEGERNAFTDRIDNLRSMMNSARTLGLQYHVVHTRIQLLLVNSLISLYEFPSSRTHKNETLEEGWTIIQCVLDWFQQPWNPAAHCWGAHLAETLVNMQNVLRESPLRRNRARAKQLHSLLSGSANQLK